MSGVSSPVADLARVPAAVNVLLLLTVGCVRADSYRPVRSSGTLLFAAFLLENALAVLLPDERPAPARSHAVTATLSMLETVGLALLAHVTWA